MTTLPPRLTLLVALVAGFSCSPAATEEPDQSMLTVTQLRGKVKYIRPSPAIIGQDSDDSWVEAFYDGESHACICVTGVYPLHEQIDRLQERFKADRDLLKRYVTVIDFELERQLVGREGATDGEWTPIDTQLFRDVVNRSSGLEPETTAELQRDSAILAPLMNLSEGHWGDETSHPALFKLNPKTDLKEVGSDEPLAELTRVLLYRYVDFDVRPGMAYRYRVRLQCTVPLDQTSIDRFAEDGKRFEPVPWTPWSEPTSKIEVQLPAEP
jgi:hypothetical protein